MNIECTKNDKIYIKTIYLYTKRNEEILVEGLEGYILFSESNLSEVLVDGYFSIYDSFLFFLKRNLPKYPLSGSDLLKYPLFCLTLYHRILMFQSINGAK